MADGSIGGDGGRAEARRRMPAGERLPQILDAALEEFAGRGYAGARMAAVAARAGIAKGLIYHYFPSKADLFAATVRACTHPTFEAAERVIGAFQGSARDLLTGLLQVAYTRIREEGRERALFRLIITEADRFPELAAFYRIEILGRGTRIARAVLEAGVASGEFRPEAATTPGLAELLMAPAITASLWHAMLGPESPNLDDLHAAHLDLLLAGLAR